MNKTLCEDRRSFNKELDVVGTWRALQKSLECHLRPCIFYIQGWFVKWLEINTFGIVATCTKNRIQNRGISDRIGEHTFANACNQLDLDPLDTWRDKAWELFERAWAALCENMVLELEPAPRNMLQERDAEVIRGVQILCNQKDWANSRGYICRWINHMWWIHIENKHDGYLFEQGYLVEHSMSVSNLKLPTKSISPHFLSFDLLSSFNHNKVSFLFLFLFQQRL